MIKPSAVFLFAAIVLFGTTIIYAQDSGKPYCDAMGTLDEGWYSSGQLINHAECTGCIAECGGAGTKSEGWFSSCENGRSGDGGMGMGPVIMYGQCSDSVSPSEQNIKPNLIQIILAWFRKLFGT